MTVERERVALQLAEQALALGPGERASFLDRECGDDRALRADVDAVLAADATDAGFLQPPTGKDVTHLIGRVPPPLPPGARVGAYVIEGVIARGGMGTVYAAIQDRPHRKVALKVLSTGFASRYAARRFAFEAEALGRLRHAGIAQIYEAGTQRDDGTELPFIAMEYVEGAATVTEHARRRKLKLGARLALMADVCDAVDHGHRRGVIHRDIKPGNILVDGQGQVKVIDFGIARASGDDPGYTTLLGEAGAIIGTLGYNSPEQLAGDPREVDTRSDVYALGVVLYELVTGRKAFQLDGLSLGEAMLVVKRTTPKPPSAHVGKLPAAVDAIVARAMAKSPDQRYRSAAALAADLRRLVERRPLEALVGGGTPTVRGRRAAQFVAGALLLVLVALLAFDRVRLGRTVEALRQEITSQRDELAEAALTVSDVARALLDESGDAGLSSDEARFRLEQADRLMARFPPEPLEEAALRRRLAEGFAALGEHEAAEAQAKRAAARESAARAAAGDGPAADAARGAAADGAGTASTSGADG